MPPDTIIVTIHPGPLNDKIRHLAIESGVASLPRMSLMLLEQSFADKRLDGARGFLRAAIREGILVGYALAKSSLEKGLADVLGRVEISEREIYRQKYRADDLNDSDRDTLTVQDMERRGDFKAIDVERERLAARSAPKKPKPAPLTPAQRDAADLLRNGGDLPNPLDFTQELDQLQPPEGRSVDGRVVDGRVTDVRSTEEEPS